MTSKLVARFEKRFPDGTLIQPDLVSPAEGFSITVLFGPSGCGKTTILRCLAGLERPERGMIQFGDETWFDAEAGVFRTPQQRDIGYLFQEYALFPHLTVARNVAYGLGDVSVCERRQRVAAMLDLLGLRGMEHRYPSQVSGGQQQRVALARVLVRRPRLLLLDEPLSALDATLRFELRYELRRLLGSFEIPVILVTHDRTEAIALADKVVVVDHGTVRQMGTVEDVFNRPSNLSVARIVGVETIHAARLIRVQEGLATLLVGDAELVAVAPRHTDGEVFICIRAEDVILEKGLSGQSSARNRLHARIISIVSDGPMIRVGLDCGFSLTALVTRPACEELGLHVDEAVTALLKAPSIHLITRAEPHREPAL